MSILYFLLAFIASGVTCAAGAYGMRFYMERNREIAEREDPRDTRIRDVQATLQVFRADAIKYKTTADEATSHLLLAHTRIDELLERTSMVNEKFTSCKDLLRKKIAESEQLIAKLSAAEQQLANLRERLQEAELELSVSERSELVDAAVETREPDQANQNNAKSDDLQGMFTPTVEEGNPSLIQCLTEELDRWKRHCHVLGDELKNRREQAGPAPAPLTRDAGDDQGSDNKSIDELTDIRGIGKVLARKLHELGVYRFQQLVSLTSEDLRRANDLIPDIERRMSRDDWTNQARNLHFNKYSEQL
jgi:predicted flap endonuclease-1-like 5' DNA nuclease